MRPFARFIVSCRPARHAHAGAIARQVVVLIGLVLPACGPFAGWFGFDGFITDCRSQCELAAGQCDEQPLESFLPFTEQLNQWRSEADSEECQGRHVGRYVGQCANDRTVLVEDFVYVWYYYFYDSPTDAFLGLRTTTDVVSPPCNGVGYWPEWISCSDPVVTEVLCDGDGYYEVGDALSLPQP